MVKTDELQVPLKVAFYLRVSTEEQIERYGLSMQQEALKALLISRGKLADGRNAFVLAGKQYIYIDEGVSGTVNIDERPSFARLKEDIIYAPEGQKPFDIVAVYKIDRFARKLKILLEIVDFFEQHNINFISAMENIDTSTAFGKAIFGIMGVIAELERETIKERCEGGREEAIKKGVMMGSNSPYGYKKDENKRLEIFLGEAKIVRLIFDMFVSGKKSFHEITKHLTEIKELTPEASAVSVKGREGEIKRKNSATFWRQEQVKAILSNELYLGYYYYDKYKNGKHLPKSEWKLSPYRFPSIIDTVTFEKAQKLLISSKYMSMPAKDGHIYLLKGLLRCDACYEETRDKKEGMIRWIGERKELKRGSGKFTYFYKCGRKHKDKTSFSCFTLPLPAKEIEEYMINFVEILLRNPITVFKHQEKLKSTSAEINHLESSKKEFTNLLNAIPVRKERLKEQHELGFMDKEKLKEKMNTINDDEKRYRERLKGIDRSIVQKNISKGYVATLEIFAGKYHCTLKNALADRQQIYDILHMLIEEIVVYSRSLTKKDSVAGKKKQNQQIPFRLHIKLKLPQEILQQFAEKGFGENQDVWWAS